MLKPRKLIDTVVALVRPRKRAALSKREIERRLRDAGYSKQEALKIAAALN